MQLRGPDEARVGQGHGTVGALARQPSQGGALSHDAEIHPKNIAQEEIDEAVDAASSSGDTLQVTVGMDGSLFPSGEPIRLEQAGGRAHAEVGGRVVAVASDRYAWSFLDVGSVVRNGRAASSGS